LTHCAFTLRRKNAQSLAISTDSLAISAYSLAISAYSLAISAYGLAISAYGLAIKGIAKINYLSRHLIYRFFHR
jgi:hypothetical protein